MNINIVIDTCSCRGSQFSGEEGDNDSYFDVIIVNFLSIYYVLGAMLSISHTTSN